MKEIFIDKNDPYFNRPKAFYILILSVFVFGGLIAYLFIPPERKIVEVPVDKVKYVDRVVEKKVEVPIEKIQYVDRVVEKKVEVPVDRIQYVDRVVERKVEVPVYIEVPVEKIVYQNPESNSSKKQNWRSLKRGMSKYDVRKILGEPDNVSSYESITIWSYGKYGIGGQVTFHIRNEYNTILSRNDKIESVSGWTEP